MSNNFAADPFACSMQFTKDPSNFYIAQRTYEIVYPFNRKKRSRDLPRIKLCPPLASPVFFPVALDTVL